MSDNGRNWCVHRTPFDREQYPVCKAGIDYHAFGPKFADKPCLGEAPATAKCASYRARTQEEWDAREADQRARLVRIGLIRSAIVSVAEAQKISAGRMPCPACKTGTVAWSMARSNGHIHARCSTPQCASWME